MTGDHLAFGSCHKERVATHVLGPLTFDVDDLSRDNGCFDLRSRLLFLSRLSDLLEPCVLEGEVLACVLVPGKVELTGGEAMASNTVVQVGDCQAQDSWCELVALGV